MRVLGTFKPPAWQAQALGSISGVGHGGRSAACLVKSRPGGWQVAIKVVWRRRGVIRPTKPSRRGRPPLLICREIEELISAAAPSATRKRLDSFITDEVAGDQETAIGEVN